MIEHTPSTGGVKSAPTCENCAEIASPLIPVANMRLCAACAAETKAILESRIPSCASKPALLWLAIDLDKLSTFGLAADSGEWVGRFVVAALKNAGATELNNLASLFTAAAAVAADAYKVEASKHRPVTKHTTTASKTQPSWAELMAEI